VSSFFNAVLLLTSTWYQFNHIGIQFYQIYHYSRLAFCLFWALPPLIKFSLRANRLVAVALFVLSLGQNRAWWARKILYKAFESKNTRTKTPVLTIILEYQWQVWVHSFSPSSGPTTMSILCVARWWSARGMIEWMCAQERFEPGIRHYIWRGGTLPPGFSWQQPWWRASG